MPRFGQSNSQGDFNYRVPPRWSPEDDNYSFRAYVTDLTLWVMLTDLQPHQQASAIIMRLHDSARELGRTVTPQDIMNGEKTDRIWSALSPSLYVTSRKTGPQ